MDTVDTFLIYITLLSQRFNSDLGIEIEFSQTKYLNLLDILINTTSDYLPVVSRPWEVDMNVEKR